MLKCKVLFFATLFSVTLAYPLERCSVDLTHPFGASTIHNPIVKRFTLDYILNNTVENGYWVQIEEYSSSTHVGTHIDAPAHFSKGGRTVDQLEFTELILPAAVVDITERAKTDSDAGLTVQDLLDWESKTGKSLNGTIVLLRSGWSKLWSNRTAFLGSAGDDTLLFHWPGFTIEAAQWLVDNRAIKAIGTESISLDIGTEREFMVHRIILPNDIFGLENVANLDQLPIYGATLYVMPMKMERGSGGPTRLFATYPNVIF
ncbi:isatin hydrolase-like [Uloborus diversus]|uniref:isatin hydrolase-like n=1 Tax=Uloborus diversus TaxID=327109 RepID=UPI002409AF80|nr:isatin hydrolase-like [Uloborus diversus]